MFYLLCQKPDWCVHYTCWIEVFFSLWVNIRFCYCHYVNIVPLRVARFNTRFGYEIRMYNNFFHNLLHSTPIRWFIWMTKETNFQSDIIIYLLMHVYWVLKWILSVFFLHNNESAGKIPRIEGVAGRSRD